MLGVNDLDAEGAFLEFQVGSVVQSKNCAKKGVVVGVFRRRALMVEVKWDDGSTAILPMGEIIPWDKVSAPPDVPITLLRNRRVPISKDALAKIEGNKELQRVANLLVAIPKHRYGKQKTNNVFREAGIKEPPKRQRQIDWEPTPITERDYQWLKKTVKGWTAKKFAYHGMSYPPPKGWRKKILKDWDAGNRALDSKPIKYPKVLASKGLLPPWHYAKPPEEKPVVHYMRDRG